MGNKGFVKIEFKSRSKRLDDTHPNISISRINIKLIFIGSPKDSIWY